MRTQIARIGEAGVSGRLLVLLTAGFVVLAGCAPGGPAPSPAPRDGGRVAGPPKVLRLDNRQDPYGFAVLIGSNFHQREINYSFHAGLTAYDAQSNLISTNGISSSRTASQKPGKEQ